MQGGSREVPGHTVGAQFWEMLLGMKSWPVTIRLHVRCPSSCPWEHSNGETGRRGVGGQPTLVRPTTNSLRSPEPQSSVSGPFCTQTASSLGEEGTAGVGRVDTQGYRVLNGDSELKRMIVG